MIDLSRHLESLLLKHNCVIVPQLGGFVAQNVSARWDEDEQSIMPPHRIVGFNSQLNVDDGLLVQSFMHTYSISYLEATRMVADEVKRLKEEINNAGSVELNGIGSLSYNENSNYIFQPCATGIASPEFYGLELLETRQIRHTKKIKSARKTRSKDKSEKKKRVYTLRINRELCNYAAAIAVAVVFYFLWATPVISPTGNQAAVAVAPCPTASHNAPQTPKPAESVTAQQSEQAADAPNEAAESSKVVQSEEVQQEPRYTLVLICDVPLKNAEAYVSELHNAGLTEAEVMKRRKMVRVVYGKYADNETAVNMLRKLRKQNDNFEEAWVMHL